MIRDMIKSFTQFINEGVDFKDNFTPLYHLTYSLDKIIETDLLKASNKVRGPYGISLTRSKFFWNDQGEGGYDFRLILNYDLLKRDGYRSYPIDEWALIGDLKKPLQPGTKRPWWSKYVKTHQLGKSNFSEFKSGKRGTLHNIESLPKKVKLEYEYEERILKDIKNLGKYIYGINIINFDPIRSSEWRSRYFRIEEYLEKYPHIKLYKGTRFLEEISLDELKTELNN